MASQKRNIIQVIRAIAIIQVVMAHTCPLGTCQYVFSPVTHICVAIFLFLSGYLTRTENDNWLAFYKKRIIRIGIPYLIWSVLYTLTDDVSRMTFNILTASAASQLYFLFVYVQCVLLTPLLGRLARSRYHFIIWLIGPVSSVIFTYFQVFHVVDYPPIVRLAWVDSCLGMIAYYYLGLILGNRIVVKRFSLRTLTVLFVLSVLVQIAEGYGWHLYGEVESGSTYKLTSQVSNILGLLIIYEVIERRWDVKSRLLRQIGDYAFGIYFCHIMVMLGLMQIPFYFSLPYLVNSALVLMVSFWACLLVNKLFGPRVSRYLGAI